MLNLKIYKLLTDIIDTAYPEDDYPDNKFKKFFLEVKPEERRGIHGRYFVFKKKIEIFNLSRPTAHVVTTTIHEVAHHIDYCLRGDSDHKQGFYEVMYQLLIAALGMGIITKEDIISENDSADKERLSKYYGEIADWEYEDIDYKTEKRTIKVKNSFSIKDELKERGYKYSPVEQAWVIDLEVSEMEEEISYLESITDPGNIESHHEKNMNIEAVYYILVMNSYDHREFLKSNGYIFNGYNIKKNSWNKKILAKEKDTEISKLNHLDGIKIKVKS